MSRRRTLVLVLAPDDWKLLERQARDNERDPFQQARWLLVQQLRAEVPAALDDQESARVAV